MTPFPLTFVVAANDRSILNANLLASPCLQESRHQLIIQKGHASAGLAYNAALEQAVNDIVVFIHQDVFLPPSWISDFTNALHLLNMSDPQWGVLGCCGITHDRVRLGHLYTPGEGVIGHPMLQAQRVRVLDEVVLALRKSSGLRFSEDIPGFHFYGPDICLTAASRGMPSYVISAFLIHNSRQYFDFPTEFYSCYWHMKHKWKAELPIQTSCICVSRFDLDLWKRRAKKMIAFAASRTLDRGPRVEDPRLLLEQIEAEERV